MGPRPADRRQGAGANRGPYAQSISRSAITVVGLGPGGRGLLTIDALEALRTATRLYAGRFTLTADAVADDGLLDVVVFPGRRLWQAAPRLLAVLVGRAPAGPRALYYRTRRLRITADEPLPVQADGDYIGTTPMDFAVVPSAQHTREPSGSSCGSRAMTGSPATLRSSISTRHPPAEMSFSATSKLKAPIRRTMTVVSAETRLKRRRSLA